jgi:hypothetical protein
MGVPEHLWRYPTGAAIDSLAKRFNLRNDPGMQDWEYEVSDPDRVDEFISAYESGELTDDERFTLMETILDSLRGATNLESDPRLQKVLGFLDENIALHIRTVCYWSIINEDDEDESEIDLLAPKYRDPELCFTITPFVRTVLEKHKHRFASEEALFWDIVEDGRAYADLDQRLALIRSRLEKLLPKGVINFERMFNQKLADAYTWDLWGAAYFINGGCSDDGFYYFRAWLVSQGKATYQEAIQNPDSLALVVGFDQDDYEFEALWYLPAEVYEALTGESIPPSHFSWPQEPLGTRWDFDDDALLSAKLPRLVAKQNNASD